MPLVGLLVLNGVVCMLLCFAPSFKLVESAVRLNTIIAPLVLASSAIYGLVIWWKRRNGRGLLLLCLACLCTSLGLCYLGIRVFYIEPHALLIRSVTIESSKVHRQLRILHISDLQAAAIGEYEKQAFSRIRKLNADLVIHTGDMLQPQRPATFESEYPKLVSLLRTLDAPLGVYGIYGNIDMPFHAVSKEGIGGMILLENEERELSFGETTVRLFALSCGLSGTPEKARGTMARWVGKSGADDFTILLGHSPDFAVAAQDFPFDLCLAGHTHGGQIRLPIVGPPFTATSHIPRSWALGYRKIGKTRLNVSGGIGSEHAGGISSMRFNCPSAMTIITVSPKKPRKNPAG